MSSAFSKAAPSITDSVSGIFGIASADPTALKAGVVAGIKQSLSVSNGFDAKPSLGFNI